MTHNASNTVPINNGADSLVATLLAGDVDVCFANPGTSEMHFVAALDRFPEMRCVLGLHEGVVVAAADGYARMAEKPAATLLHLGPGLANGLSHLHNAGRANSPIVNIVGDHATYHRHYDAPLTSDIEATARPFSHWVRTSASAQMVAQDGAAAIAASRMLPGKIATLILPANTAWDPATEIGITPASAGPAIVSRGAIARAARVLRSGEPTLLLLTGAALRGAGPRLAAQIADKTGAKVLSQVYNPRAERGAGRIPIERIPYAIDRAVAILSPFRHIILVGAKQPVGFFAYPDKPSVLTPDDCECHVLSTLLDDSIGALEALADAVDARGMPAFTPRGDGRYPTGAITIEGLARVIGAALPEGAIVVDESVSTGRDFFRFTHDAAPHDWLQNMGGSIGFGLPLAVGAAIASPDRKVLCLEGDGSGMYSPQALWSHAREGLNITTLIFANRTYAILKGELKNVGATAGRRAMEMLEIDRPTIDWVGLARSMGVEACRAETLEDVYRGLKAGFASSGPYLVEAVF